MRGRVEKCAAAVGKSNGAWSGPPYRAERYGTAWRGRVEKFAAAVGKSDGAWSTRYPGGIKIRRPLMIGPSDLEVGSSVLAGAPRS